MELLNFIRYKEKGINPTVKNNSVNCSVNIITMKPREDIHSHATLTSHKAIDDSYFTLSIDVENDASHFEGLNLLVPHGPSKLSSPSSHPKPEVKFQKPVISTKPAPAQSKPSIKKETITKAVSSTTAKPANKVTKK